MVLGGLEGNVQYAITVKGFNSIGQGPASAAVTAKTRKAPPVQPPSNLLWIQEGNNVSLSWDPVKAKENESDVIGYMVLLKQEGRGHNQVTRTINPSTMLSLPEGGTYVIEVRALSEGGEGSVSSPVRLVTSSGVRAKSGHHSLHVREGNLTWTTLLLLLLVPSVSCHCLVEQRPASSDSQAMQREQFLESRNGRTSRTDRPFSSASIPPNTPTFSWPTSRAAEDSVDKKCFFFLRFF
ncbi:contactin-5-like [Dunckerocampus dactyliophorus]|uniref:contactin-5-like n=1 Tax=Dunckerocampus dactyliophorus TaxID=161453 RepID=UPI00240660EF|nr:contactin-5-like [Dunckerocampus dactyliophorus]XP_054615843.1 contactin-5-like [Dunckerocampus dactyliophorus]